jgi:hypothetical protein
MTSNRSYFLNLLDTDSTERSRLVEALRASAGILDGTGKHGMHMDHYVGLVHAPQLRELAQYLCDHVRVSSDHRCRYCELILAEPGA